MNAEEISALLVEDNMPMRVLLRSLLYSLGIKAITEASRADLALELLTGRGADLIVTDLSMQPMDGIAFTKAVRSGDYGPNPFVPIIMVTGHTERHRVEAARDAGVTEFLAKPITVQNLILRISEIVDRPRAFVRTEGYFGPDRRRRNGGDHMGPWRRQEDSAPVELELI